MPGRATPPTLVSGAEQARRWILSGQVQGVGFRPFVYRIACRNHLKGWVRNGPGTVEIHAQGDVEALCRFDNGLIDEAPVLARPVKLSCEVVALESGDDFHIVESVAGNDSDIHVPVDLFVCDDCLKEFNDPADRRHRYPFINCTQCGPRYSLIQAMPYDRASTTMAPFALCARCQAEYTNPVDRRFHAEPVACPDCGPTLSFHAANGRRVVGNDPALQACTEALARGSIVAVKGVGGYHLMCDARNDEAIARLRIAKPRPHKPLAVMFPAPPEDPLSWLRPRFEFASSEADFLLSPTRPIVLLRHRAGCDLSQLVAPGLSETGVMLPYSPLHHRLLGELDRPLVATSANLGGEPVLTDEDAVETRLDGIADAFLHHNRVIQRPADDPVYRPIAGRARPLRLGRGNAPLDLDLPFRLPEPILAVGGHMKTTVALAWENRAVVSPHIGDMDSPRSREVFEETVNDLCSLYAVDVQSVVCDAHPGYATTRWASRCGLPVDAVFHHHAHASAAVGLEANDTPWLVFTWDGVGYGEDGTLWGGEALLGLPGAWKRVASQRPFRLPGADRAGREPWRSAASLTWETGLFWADLPDRAILAYQAWERNMNAPSTTAMGRLFDAASALLGVCQEASFEGQGPMYLEHRADTGVEGIQLPLAPNREGVLETDWAPLVPYLLNDDLPVSIRAGGFHASLSMALVDQAVALRDQYGVTQVALSGGVFQNRLLCEQALAGLSAQGFRVRLPGLVPVNDAGLSIGQIIEMNARYRETDDVG